MLKLHLKDCEEFISGDAAILREFLHPDKQDVKINYSLAHGKIKPGQKTKPHKLKTAEVYYFLQGKAVMCIGEERVEAGPDTVVYVPPDAVQYVENIGENDLKFLCIVDPAWREQDEQIITNK